MKKSELELLNETVFGYVSRVIDIKKQNDEKIILYISGSEKVEAHSSNLNEHYLRHVPDTVKVHLTPVVKKLEDLKELREGSIVKIDDETLRMIPDIENQNVLPQGDLVAKFHQASNRNAYFYATITNGYHSMSRIKQTLKNKGISSPAFYVEAPFN
jgi:hypothetical protein